MTFATILALGLVASVQGQTASQFKFSQQNSTNYVGMSNGTIVNSPMVPGKVFDRNIIIMFENKDYEEAAASATFQKLAKKGILFTDYYGITHPSQGNYIADTAAHEFPNSPADVKTVVDLLEAKDISWAAYMENMPEVGYKGLDYSSHNYNVEGGDDYNYYARRHSGLMKFDSITDNPERLARHRNFNNFAEDLQNDALPQWVWITPNVNNDGHDTSVKYAADFLEYFLVPLLKDERFNNNRTLITVTWDESQITGTDNNHIYVLAVGNAVPESLHNTEDDLYYNHYSQLSTVEANWDLGNLGEGDKNANVYSFMGQGLERRNDDAEPAVADVSPVVVADA
ncbi:hypothetical protein RQP46_007882 [Phenoliferia psychrophenolica]